MPTLDEFRALYLESVDAFNRRDWESIVNGLSERFQWHFLARLVARGAGAASGAPIQLDFAQVWEFDGEEAVRCRAFPDFSEALVKARQ